MNIETAHERFPNQVRLVGFASLRRERLAWQNLPVREIYRGYDIYFFLGNPRVISTVLLASALRLLGKHVVIWGQGHSAGAKPAMEKLRLGWWRLFKYIFLYTENEVSALRAYGFTKQTLIGMNNGLDQEEITEAKSNWKPATLAKWQKEHCLPQRTILLSCARLTQKNQFHHMVAALPEIIARVPDVLWVVIGDGPRRDALHKYAQERDVSSHILWIGAIHEEARLAAWFLSAQIFVHPGAIGLSLLHAYGYGLPVITHSDAQRHMPAFAAMTKSNLEHCCKPDSPADLSTTLVDLLQRPARIKELSDDVLRVTERYNTTIMAERFIQMAKRCAAQSTIGTSIQ